MLCYNRGTWLKDGLVDIYGSPPVANYVVLEWGVR